MDNISQIVVERLELLGAGPKDRCLVGLSGGQDSTALLLALLAGRSRPGTLAAAHLDHAVRDGSAHDSLEVERLCRGLGVRFIGHRLDPDEVRDQYRETGSLEASLRKFRYDFLFSAAASFGAKWVITGHTRDDQVETVLFRMLRGMNPMSFSGIPEMRSGILRPILGLRRSQTLAYCLDRGIVPLTDSSNFDHRHARNRLRCRTIPLLETHFHSGLNNHMIRLASLAGRLDAFKEKILDEFLGGVLDPPGCVFHKGGFEALPHAVRAHAVAGFLKGGMRKWPSRTVLKEALGRIMGGRKGPMSLPGGMIMVSDGAGFTIRPGGRDGRNDLPVEPVPFPLPGVLRFGYGGIMLSSEEITLESPIVFPGGNTVLIRKSHLRTPLWVRRRLPGDRLVPLRMSGRKKLKDFLIDRKIPRDERDHIPLVLDNDGEILWVGGVEVSQCAALEGYF